MQPRKSLKLLGSLKSYLRKETPKERFIRVTSLENIIRVYMGKPKVKDKKSLEDRMECKPVQAYLSENGSVLPNKFARWD